MDRETVGKKSSPTKKKVGAETESRLHLAESGVVKVIKDVE